MMMVMWRRLVMRMGMVVLLAQPAGVADVVLLDDAHPARALIPSVANSGSGLGTAWTTREFDDAGWMAGQTGVGFDADPGTGGDYRSAVRLNVGSMRGVNASVFVRIPFSVDPAVRQSLRRLTLQMKYDDGFVAWINGERVAAALAPGDLAWNSTTAGGATHEANLPGPFAAFDLTAHLGLLRDGENVLALQGLNASVDSNDLLLLPRLLGSENAPPVWPTPGFEPVDGAEGLDFPVAVRTAFDGSGRLFIVERTGRILSWKAGTLTPFLDLRDRVLSSPAPSDERGLLGLAFPPGFGVLFRHFYVYYTTNQAPRPGDQVLTRVFLHTGTNATADPASEREILRLENPFGNHNGGDIHFGPDGYLYVGLGDGGGANDPDNRAQNPNDWWGKMLRIDTESGSPISSTYAVPISNPFVGLAGVRPEIWHLGLRNPWRWSFDRDTGALWIGDVGQDAWEEISYAPPNTPALNFGWRRYEGSRLRPGEPVISTDPEATVVTIGTLTPPVAEIPHTTGDRSLIGGYVYRGTEFPRFHGIYIHADFLSGRVYGVQPDGTSWLHRELTRDPSLRLSSFGEDEDGALYATQLESGGPATGRLYKVVDRSERERLVIFEAARDPTTGRMELTFGAVIGGFYQPEVSEDLRSWRVLGPVIKAESSRVSFTEPEGMGAAIAPRYFRVREW